MIPAKAKPGRKPKPVVQEQAAKPDEPERRMHNRSAHINCIIDQSALIEGIRAAQRAFRERKLTHVQELQARIQQYEQGEVERNVALQNIARRLKEENIKLIKENQALREALDQASGTEGRTLELEDKNKGDDVTSKKLQNDTSDELVLLSSAMKIRMASHSPSTFRRSRADSESTNSEYYHSHGFSVSAVQPATMPPMSYDEITKLTCGFCSDDTTCVCHQMSTQQASDSLRESDFFPAEPFEPSHGTDSQGVSILDKLPAYSPPIPLRRRAQQKAVASIFPVTPAPAPTETIRGGRADAQCSGDPKNCLACADDSFGKAFCEAIEQSVAAAPPCDDCPSSSGGGQTSDNDITMVDGTIPTDDAWRRIKSHPNAGFANLSLLADVVSRRATCAGPSSVPRAEEESRPQLVPQDVLIQCGQKHRLRHVHESSVRAALDLLDANFNRS